MELRSVFNDIIEYFDFTVLYGHRTPEDQFELFKQGRKPQSGIWVISDKSKIVTYKDGFDLKSTHNEYPSKGIDVTPYPIEWNNIKKQYYFAGRVMEKARQLDVKLIWGGNWDGDEDFEDQSFNDLCHFQVRT